ncbi:hypothetical protein V8E55_001069 [Tylopilus felleus]
MIVVKPSKIPLYYYNMQTSLFPIVESAIGKALWHQITTVIVSPVPGHPFLSSQKFQNVSIITAWNSHKDQINELGCTRFAKDNNQCLTPFYSEDISLADSDITNNTSKRTRHSRNAINISKKVVGWTSTFGHHYQLMLDMLFVELENPATVVQLENLPLNVVPIVCIRCRQVHVLPNFAMTDYNHCQLHQSYYTALLRSATAEGTAIIHSFDISKITGGLSGWLKKEFRELELLDDISTHRFENTLPSSVIGHT